MQLEISARVLSMMIQVVKVSCICLVYLLYFHHVSRHLINAPSFRMLLGYVVIVTVFTYVGMLNVNSKANQKQCFEYVTKSTDIK